MAILLAMCLSLFRFRAVRHSLTSAHYGMGAGAAVPLTPAADQALAVNEPGLNHYASSVSSRICFYANDHRSH